MRLSWLSVPQNCAWGSEKVKAGCSWRRGSGKVPRWLRVRGRCVQSCGMLRGAIGALVCRRPCALAACRPLLPRVQKYLYMLWESLCSRSCSLPLPGLGFVLLPLFFFFFLSFFLFQPFTKTPILPPRPGDLHRKLTLNTAKERRGRLGRGSSHKMRCVALCVPFVIPCTMNCPGHPPALGYPQVPHLPCPPPQYGSGPSWGCSSPDSRE